MCFEIFYATCLSCKIQSYNCGEAFHLILAMLESRHTGNKEPNHVLQVHQSLYASWSHEGRVGEKSNFENGLLRMIILKLSGTKSWINFQLNQYWMSNVIQLIYLISTYSEDILHNLFSRKYFLGNWLVTESVIISFSSSNEVCSPIPVTFSKFGWAKIRTVKLPIQDSMMKLCKKKTFLGE